MDSRKEKKPRIRRTNLEIDESLFKATEELVATYGFSNLSMKVIYTAANIEHAVFYKRYNDLNDFLEKFVRKYDYWLNDSMEFDPKLDALQNFQNILVSLVDCILESPSMQKLLIWEMSENNFITQRTAQSRDMDCNQFINYFIEEYKDSDVDYSYTCSLIIGGIYYLILHREMGTINFIDFSKKESMEKLKGTIRIIINKLFSEPKSSEGTHKAVRNETIRIAKELIKSNVDYSIIKQTTKLDDIVLQSLIDSSQKA